MKNFWRMRACSIFSVPYAYVDHCSYLADTLFVQNKVRLKFKNEYVKAESPYRIIFCKVRKMLLCGYRYYLEVCSEIAGMFEEGMRIGR